MLGVVIKEVVLRDFSIVVDLYQLLIRQEGLADFDFFVLIGVFKKNNILF
jgi:hypothetical protein